MNLTPPPEERTAARHARVVPAFFAAIVQRSMQSRVGHVQPLELLRWERKSDLSEGARRELRQIIIKRSRVQAQALWPMPIGVRLAEGWRTQLQTLDRKRIESLVAATQDKPLEQWTLREFKEALHLPLERSLDLLALLESVYWIPPPETTRRRVVAEESAPAVRVTDDLRDTAREVLSIPWLSTVSPRDLRFPYEGGDALPDWIQSQLEKDYVPGSFHRFLERLLAASKSTADDEAMDIILAAANQCAPRAGGPEKAERWADIFARRYISRTGAGRTLLEVGVAVELTRERVRQICDAFEELLPDAEIAAPALDRVLQAAARVAPAQVDDLDEQLRRFIGDDAGIEALVAWAKVIGRRHAPVECQRVRTKLRRQTVEVTMVQRPDAPLWVEPMIRHIARDTSMFGCTNVLRIAGRLALKEGVAPGQEAIETALEAAAGFRWLDRQTGWFTLGDTSICSAASRLRKIIAVTQESIGTDEIAAALASDDMLMYREASSLGLATPPVHVLRELFLGWSWIKVIQKSRFVAGPGFEPKAVLSDVEQTIADVIALHDGIACRFELKDAVVQSLGLTDVLLAATLGSSPIVERVEFGLYRIRGRRLGDNALAAARRRSRERITPSLANLPDAMSNEFLVRVTEAALRNEQYTVPAAFLSQLCGKRHRVLSNDGNVIGEAKVTKSGSLSGLNRLFPAACAGDHFRVEVTVEGVKVRHMPEEEAHPEPLPRPAPMVLHQQSCLDL